MPTWLRSILHSIANSALEPNQLETKLFRILPIVGGVGKSVRKSNGANRKHGCRLGAGSNPTHATARNGCLCILTASTILASAATADHRPKPATACAAYLHSVAIVTAAKKQWESRPKSEAAIVVAARTRESCRAARTNVVAKLSEHWFKPVPGLLAYLGKARDAGEIATVTMYWPPVIELWKLAEVSTAPVSPPPSVPVIAHAPKLRISRAASVHTTRESMKVPNMAVTPCRTVLVTHAEARTNCTVRQGGIFGLGGRGLLVARGKKDAPKCVSTQSRRVTSRQPSHPHASTNTACLIA